MRRMPIERNARLLCLLVGVLALLGTGATMAGEDLAGKTLFVECDQVDLGVFESSALISRDEEPEPLLIFDQSLLPSDTTTVYRDVRDRRYLKIVRPYDGASFPRNIAPPAFRWEDQADNVWMLSVYAPGLPAPLRVVTGKREWRPDAATWEAIKASGTGKWIELEVRGCLVRDRNRVGEAVYVDRIKLRVSEHPADPFIVFRFVSPLFHGFKTPHVYYRDVETFGLRMFLPSEGAYCTNCHSFPSGPRTAQRPFDMAIAVRKSFTGLRVLGLYDFASRQGKTLLINSFFMCWDGEGKRVAVTGGQKVLVRSPITLETQEFHVVVGDILIVDTETLAVNALPGASEAEYVETFPAWSPDGETIVFARDKEIIPGRVMPQKRYSLFRIPYNNGRGGEIAPLLGADDGMSNFAPRFSPDGKWIAFNKADSASLVEPTADLWIISTEPGSYARELECNYDYAMDSHHSWSSNSRWLLFSSKRDGGIFARVYLTEIDEEGHASPPVELPAADDPMMCYNVPEFLQYRPEIDPEDILRKVSFVDE